MNNDPVKEYKALVRKPRHDEALQLLKRLASQVKPVLLKHNWTIKNLVEFFPNNPNLLGMNTNKGWKINLRLRPHYDETQFLEYQDILGTLLHEMAHIVRGPHDEHFYKLLDELRQETELLMASGYRGEGFYSDGHLLGFQSVPRYMSSGIAAKAAEKRLQTSRIMLPTGGIRLGGGGPSTSRHMTPTQAAARAAQKRQLDKVWCGGSVVEPNSGCDSGASSSAPISPTAVPLSPSDNVTRKRKLSSNIPSEMDTQSKKQRRETSVIDLTTTTLQNDGWACPTCTFFNGPITLACQICLTERPHDDAVVDVSDDFWSCPQCTLKNEKKWTTCVACQFVLLR
ncbi:WLM-domain-containing protein [Mucor ambiguus]|uniref:WLM-domain-containing protein n=1 Tax=Mucor ambiguus TaxID=91626 RepID=A0A0C9MK62_9FUNG|nr:WLM-domain-containing protein [Mucor ambiguus]